MPITNLEHHKRQARRNSCKYFNHPIDALVDKKGEHLDEINRIIGTLDFEKPEIGKDGYWELNMAMIQDKHPDAFAPLNLLLNYIAECDSVIILLNDYQKIMGDFV